MKTVNRPHILFLMVWLSVSLKQASGAGGELSCPMKKVLRVVGGATELEGRLEVCGEGFLWSTVHRKSLQYPVPQLACNKMGYSQFNVTIHNDTAIFGEGSGPITELHCTQNSTQANNLLLCTLLPVMSSNHSQDSGITCKPLLCQDWDVRLVGGGSAMEGRVEVCKDEQWGAVQLSTDIWTVNDAGVVCFQLGHSRFGASVTNGSQFTGENTGPVYSINCGGDEAKIAECSTNEAPSSTTETVGIMCQQKCALCRKEEISSTSLHTATASHTVSHHPMHTISPTSTTISTPIPTSTAPTVASTIMAEEADAINLSLVVAVTGSGLAVLLIVGIVLCVVVLVKQKASSSKTNIQRSEPPFVAKTTTQMQYNFANRSHEPRSHDLGALPRAPGESTPEYDQLEEYELMVRPHTKKDGSTHRQGVSTATNVAYEKVLPASQSNPGRGYAVPCSNTRPVILQEDPTKSQDAQYEIIPYSL